MVGKMSGLTSFNLHDLQNPNIPFSPKFPDTSVHDGAMWSQSYVQI
jgi:hypothetical protein